MTGSTKSQRVLAGLMCGLMIGSVPVSAQQYAEVASQVWWTFGDERISGGITVARQAARSTGSTMGLAMGTGSVCQPSTLRRVI